MNWAKDWVFTDKANHDIKVKILISIVIPVKNGDAWLDKTMPAILGQSLMDQTELIVIDSGSTDRTKSILEKYPVKLINIPSNEFNHGATRNLGVENSTGKYVVMTVQDAKPVGKKWLELLLEPFSDEKVAAVCGQQIVPHDSDKNPIQWFRPVSKPSIRKVFYPGWEEFGSLSPQEKRNACSWDNVNAMYRRESLVKIPFRNVDFAEDMHWAKDALESGYCLVHSGFAQVEHYHNNSSHSNFVRQFAEDFLLYKMFGIMPKNGTPNSFMMLRDMKRLLKENRVSFRDKWKWLQYNRMLRESSKQANLHFFNSLALGEDNLEDSYQKLNTSFSQPLKPVLS
ncbi:MAG: glycosyltransferase family 2 protein [Chitinophagales bacterium]